MSGEKWGEWVKKLTQVKLGQTTNFSFFGILRNGHHEDVDLMWRSGVHGVREADLWRQLGDLLEDSYRRLSSSFSVGPETRYDGRFPVFLCAVDDDVGPGFALMEERLLVSANLNQELQPASMIVLPTRTNFDSYHDSLQACAVHELSHLIRSRDLPHARLEDKNFRRADTKWLWRWRWLDEGLACAAENELLPSNSYWLQHAYEWADRPHWSLVDYRLNYAAVMFVRYLKRYLERCGAQEVLFKAWRNSRFVWDPHLNPRGTECMTALESLAAELADVGVEFCSATQADLFASCYCFDSLFMNDPSSLGYEPLVFQRHGPRAMTGVFPFSKTRREDHSVNPVLARADSAAGTSRDARPFELPPLSCHLFHLVGEPVIPEGYDSRWEISVESNRRGKLKLEMVAIDRESKRAIPGSRQLGRASITSSGSERLTVGIAPVGTQIDYYAVVTNCDWRGEGDYPPYDRAITPNVKFHLAVRPV